MVKDEQGRPEIHSLFDLYLLLWRNGISVNLNSLDNVRIYPSPDDWLLKVIQDRFFDDVMHYLPGFCDGCMQWVMQRVQSYWGARPHLCPLCTAVVVSRFEIEGRWPPASWDDDETF